MARRMLDTCSLAIVISAPFRIITMAFCLTYRKMQIYFVQNAYF